MAKVHVFNRHVTHNGKAYGRGEECPESLQALMVGQGYACPVEEGQAAIKPSKAEQEARAKVEHESAARIAKLKAEVDASKEKAS